MVWSSTVKERHMVWLLLSCLSWRLSSAPLVENKGGAVSLYKWPLVPGEEVEQGMAASCQLGLLH